MDEKTSTLTLRLAREGGECDPRVGEMGERAEGYMAGGRCCTEAVILAAIDAFAPDTPKAVATAAGGLCGGMGTREATCGVYTGAALALGVVRPGEDAAALKEAAAEFQHRLVGEVGGLVCQELRERMGEPNRDGALCRRLTARGAEIVAEMVAERTMEPGE